MGEISNLEYKMTWIDHLDALYSSFIRRNNPDEWFYFLRRPEFAQKAALFNIETFFGWVSDVETFCDALSPTSFASIA